MLVHLVWGVVPNWYEPNGDWIASLNEHAVDDAVFSWTGGDLHSTLVGFDDCALDEDVSSNVVGVRSVFDHVVNGSKGGLSILGVVDADLVSGHHTNHGVAPGLSVDLSLGFANESELLLGGYFCGTLAASLNLASTGWFAS